MTKLIAIPDRFIVTDEQFEQLAIANQELKLETTSEGVLVVMPPTGGDTGRKNMSISAQLYFWNKNTLSGYTFDSSTLFVLPSGAKRSPDASWVEKSRWEALTVEQQKSFPPLCPDFVIELKSPSDSLKSLQTKMREYMDNGAKLGWLIVPDNKTIYVYEADGSTQTLSDLIVISGGNILPGFELDLKDIFD
ncbi:MAG: Uma2 family endonuclease [Prochloraceae cyanobacterium]|nr:Uma2 family endonuclease [Prochloraceae cyanobacterium]